MKNSDMLFIGEDINLLDPESDEETELLIAELRKLNPCSSSSSLDDE